MPKTAIIVVDMIKDNMTYLKGEADRIIPSLQRLLSSARKSGIPIIYANDSFLPNDFMFSGRMSPHAIRGTKGVKVITELKPEPSDIILDKRRLSAFLKTDLDITLRTLGIDTVAVAGINTEACVLMTALDAVSNDFNVAILEDCCTSTRRFAHEAVISVYRRTALYPLLRITTSEEFLSLRKAGE